MHCFLVGWVLKLGPVVDDLYDYMIVAAETKNETFARTRNISRFDEYYDDEVREWLKEHDSPVRREEHPEGCQYYVPEGFYCYSKSCI